jgi:hypothetical protein
MQLRRGIDADPLLGAGATASLPPSLLLPRSVVDRAKLATCYSQLTARSFQDRTMSRRDVTSGSPVVKRRRADLCAQEPSIKPPSLAVRARHL